jgi:hypothetical protein
MAAVMIGDRPAQGLAHRGGDRRGGGPLGELRVRSPASQAERLVAWAAGWPERIWAVEGAGGLGYLLAQQLVAAGERVLDVQPKLGARVRLLATGATSKNDPSDARCVAIAALRSASRREVAADDHAAVLKVWSKRRRDLGRTRTQVACRLHAAGCELVPGGISKEITAARAAHVLEPVKPSGAVALARCEFAAEFPEDLRRTGAQMRDTKKRLAVVVRASGTTHRDLRGRPGHRRHRDRLRRRRVPLCQPGSLHCLQRHRADRGVVGEPQDLPAVPAREPAAQPRHPHGRGHPGPPPSLRWPGLLRPQAGRGQDPQRGTPLPQAAGQRCHLRPPPGRCPAGRRSGQRTGPGRATGERH